MTPPNTSRLTETELQELIEMEKAVPSEWYVEDYRSQGDWRSTGLIWARDAYGSKLGTCMFTADIKRDFGAGSPPDVIAAWEKRIEFTIALRNSAPSLLREIVRLRKQLGEAIESLKWVSNYGKSDMYSCSTRMRGIVLECETTLAEIERPENE